ncbi:MAG: ABC transporter substrate-binding protein [Nitrospirota bacterium]
MSALLLFSCASHENNSYLHLRLTDDPTTLDPAYIVDVPGGQVAAKIFDGLVSYDDKARIIPGLASSWSVSPDGRTYTFNIRPGVKFSDGREVTSADFKYSFERVLSPKTNSPRTWLFDRIKGARQFMEGKSAEVVGIKCPDSRTLVIELREPFGPFLGLLAMPGAYVVPKEEVAKYGEHFSDHPVGTGPYTLLKWDHGSRIVLKANRNYFGGRPGVSGISYRVIPEELTAVAEFERGNLDALNVPAPEFRRYSQDPRWNKRLLSQVGLNTYYLGMNCQKAPLNDVRVRRAISMAIDRKRILETVYEGRGVLASGPVPDFLLPANPSSAGEGLRAAHVRPDARRDQKRGGTASLGSSGHALSQALPGTYEYNPAEAKRLLKEAGYPDGISLKIYIGDEQETLDMVEVIQQYLADVGVKTSIVQLEWSAFKQAINNGDADLFWLSWQADYPDPENFLYPVFYSGNTGPAGNRARFQDKKFDALITRAQGEPNPEKRIELYRQAQSRVVKMAPWVFFWHKKDYVVLGPRVKGYRLYPISNSDKGLGVTIGNK